MLGPVALAVACKTVKHVLGQVLAARQALGSDFEFAVRERANLWPDEWSPADGQGDGARHEQDDHQQSNSYPFDP